MHSLAATITTADRLREIPGDFWLKLLLAVVVLAAGIIVLRKIAKVNKVILTVVVAFFLVMGGFSWIYERNEPAWATPFVSWVGGFFPTKGKVAVPAKVTPTGVAKKS